MHFCPPGISDCKHPCAGRDYSIVMLRYCEPISGRLRIRSILREKLGSGELGLEPVVIQVAYHRLLT